MRKILAISIILLLLAGPQPSAAFDFNAAILSLQRQIAALQAQLQAIRQQLPAPAQFTVPLYRGLTHPQVRSLQEFLRQLPGIYPEGLVTGHFGFLTEAAVKRFQTQQGLPAVGAVGPQTRAKLNELTGASSSGGTVSRIIPEEPSMVNATVTPREIEPTVALPANADFSLRAGPIYDVVEIEQLIQARINTERSQAGLVPLVWSSPAAAVARRHSQDQVADNIDVTPIELPCSYPLLRHSGFTFGFSVAERVRNSGISYRSVGENLVMFPVSVRLVYRYLVAEGPVDCPAIDSLNPTVPTRVEVDEAIAERKRILQNVRSVEWVNREWLTDQEIAAKAVRLWLDSPGHRRNLLDPDFNEGGVGIAAVNDHFIITHVLLSR